MALRTIMLRHNIETLRKELEALREKDAEFATREAEIEAAIAEATEPDQREAVEAAVASFEAEQKKHTEETEGLEQRIADLEKELEEEERKAPAPKAPEKMTERSNKAMALNLNIRSLPRNKRAFDALPMEQRDAIISQDEVKTFLSRMREMKGQQRAVNGAELTIPIVFLDLIAENMYRYSKLLDRVRVREVSGESRQTIAGTVPEAVWTEMCGIINELSFEFNQVTTDGYKVAGFIPVCNSILEDNDVNLASWIVEMLSEAIGLATDKAILYGKGAASKMPLGIVTRLAQTEQPASYPANAPAWVDLHASHLISLDASLTGAAFWSALTLAAGNAFSRYARGTQFWAMNSKTYNALKAKVITFTASGDIAANVFATLPVITGDIVILEFMPDNDIIGGYGDLYLWADRAGMTIESSREVQFIQDNTVFKGKRRADGMPVIPEAFVAINIAGAAPVTSMAFAADSANTVSGIILPAALTVKAGASVALGAVLTPFGVKGTITYTSATPANATVDAKGVVTAVKAGSSVITAACEGFKATCTVTVE